MSTTTHRKRNETKEIPAPLANAGFIGDKGPMEVKMDGPLTRIFAQVHDGKIKSEAALKALLAKEGYVPQAAESSMQLSDVPQAADSGASLLGNSPDESGMRTVVSDAAAAKVLSEQPSSNNSNGQPAPQPETQPAPPPAPEPLKQETPKSVNDPTLKPLIEPLTMPITPTPTVMVGTAPPPAPTMEQLEGVKKEMAAQAAANTGNNKSGSSNNVMFKPIQLEMKTGGSMETTAAAVGVMNDFIKNVNEGKIKTEDDFKSLAMSRYGLIEEKQIFGRGFIYRVGEFFVKAMIVAGVLTFLFWVAGQFAGRAVVPVQ
jgi:hypothetical protein